MEIWYFCDNEHACMHQVTLAGVNVTNDEDDDDDDDEYSFSMFEL